MFLLQAAANYFALRVHNSPQFNGIQLDTQEHWAQGVGMLEQVVQSGE
jgi:hypothetical protein